MVEYQVLREILGPDTDGGYCFTPEVCISPDRMGALREHLPKKKCFLSGIARMRGRGGLPDFF